MLNIRYIRSNNYPHGYGWTKMLCVWIEFIFVPHNLLSFPSFRRTHFPSGQFGAVRCVVVSLCHSPRWLCTHICHEYIYAAVLVYLIRYIWDWLVFSYVGCLLCSHIATHNRCCLCKMYMRSQAPVDNYRYSLLLRSLHTSPKHRISFVRTNNITVKQLWWINDVWWDA